MEFETCTSIYEVKLDREKEIFTVKKIRVKRGKTSVVASGREFKGDRIEINSVGSLILFREGKAVIRTSPLENL